MKLLVLVHDAEAPSYHRALAERLAGELEARGHLVDLSGPRLDRLRLTREEYDRGRKTGRYPDDVQREHRRLTEADGLVLVFPLWWMQMPAELKGWLDRVLSYGVAYELDGEEPLPRLATRRAATIVTTGTPDAIYGTDGSHGNLAHAWNEHVFRFCGFRPVGNVFCGNAVLAGDAERNEHRARVDALASALTAGTAPETPVLWPAAASGKSGAR